MYLKTIVISPEFIYWCNFARIQKAERKSIQPKHQQQHNENKNRKFKTRFNQRAPMLAFFSLIKPNFHDDCADLFEWNHVTNSERSGLMLMLSVSRSGFPSSPRFPICKCFALNLTSKQIGERQQSKSSIKQGSSSYNNARILLIKACESISSELRTRMLWFELNFFCDQ